MTRPPADRVVACGDPDCDGLAEPEQDGDVTYHACRDCGYEFNYQRLAPNQSTCAAGLPEALRRASQPELPLMQIGRRHADAS